MRPDNSTPEAGRILISGIFACGAFEEAFRSKYLRQDLRLSLCCVLTGIVGAVLFLVHDYALFGKSSQFFGLLGLRSTIILACLAVALLLQRCTSPQRADRILLFWCLLMAAGHAYALTTRPIGFVWHSLMCIGIVYCVIPLPLKKQLVITVTYSIVVLSLEVGLGLDILFLLPLVGAFLLTNAFGMLTSWQLNHRRRQVYHAWLTQSRLRQELEQAMAEIKTLRGMLSICAWCKRIREDGQWLPIEEYVKEHSLANFTHGMCPQCLEEQLDEQPFAVPARV